MTVPQNKGQKVGTYCIPLWLSSYSLLEMTQIKHNHYFESSVEPSGQDFLQGCWTPKSRLLNLDKIFACFWPICG